MITTTIPKIPETNTVWYHLQVESKKKEEGEGILKLIERDSRKVVARGWGLEEIGKG